MYLVSCKSCRNRRILHLTLLVIVSIALCIGVVYKWQQFQCYSSEGTQQRVARFKKLYIDKIVRLKSLPNSSLELESEQIWRRSKIKRLVALQQSDNSFLSHCSWNKHTTHTIIDYFLPSYSCPLPIQRIGHLGDGGKWVCGFSHIAKRGSKCIVYSFGISNEVSFEAEILQRSKCIVYMYDHTIDINIGPAADLVNTYPGRAYLYKIGLGSENTRDLRSLATLMTVNGHTFVDIIKMDVEGTEFDALRNFVDRDSLNGLPLQFGQLQVEIHISYTGLATPDGCCVLLDFAEWFDLLEDKGRLRPFYAEPNQISRDRSFIGFYEYAFLNGRLPSNYF